MEATQPAHPAQPLPTAAARARNGLGVAALVIGVASLVAAISFLLFPLGLVGGLVGLVIAIIAFTRGRHRGATNSGQAIAGLVCSVLALIVAIGLSVQLGTWAARTPACSPGSTTASPTPETVARSRPASPASPTRYVSKGSPRSATL